MQGSECAQLLNRASSWEREISVSGEQEPWLWFLDSHKQLLSNDDSCQQTRHSRAESAPVYFQFVNQTGEMREPEINVGMWGEWEGRAISLTCQGQTFLIWVSPSSLGITQEEGDCMVPHCGHLPAPGTARKSCIKFTGKSVRETSCAVRVLRSYFSMHPVYTCMEQEWKCSGGLPLFLCWFIYLFRWICTYFLASCNF